jgi:hypothetical protein
MPSKPRKKATIYAEVDPKLKRDFEAFAQKRGRTLTAELEAAMRRHLAYPPPAQQPPPFPDGHENSQIMP